MSDDATENTKPWSYSRTLWFNSIAAVLLVIESQLSLIKPFLGEARYAAFAIILLSVNSLLRVVTTTRLTFK